MCHQGALGPQQLLIRPDIQPCGNGFGLAIMGGLALDHQDNVYVSVNSCHVPDHGIWHVTPAGQPSWLASLPATAAPNGIAYHAGWLYVADAVLGVVWRVGANGSGLVAVWTNDPLLTPVPVPLTPGPNGLQDLYITNAAFPFFPGPPCGAPASCGSLSGYRASRGLEDCGNSRPALPS